MLELDTRSDVVFGARSESPPASQMRPFNPGAANPFLSSPSLLPDLHTAVFISRISSLHRPAKLGMRGIVQERKRGQCSIGRFGKCFDHKTKGFVTAQS